MQDGLGAAPVPPYLRLIDSEPWRKHWNSFFMDSSLMPMPVSRMVTCTSWRPVQGCVASAAPMAPSLQWISASDASLHVAVTTTSPFCVNFTAFAKMLASTCAYVCAVKHLLNGKALQSSCDMFEQRASTSFDSFDLQPLFFATAQVPIRLLISCTMNRAWFLTGPTLVKPRYSKLPDARRQISRHS